MPSPPTHVEYRGRAGVRTFARGDMGLSRPYRFTPGEPVEVDPADVEAFLSGPHKGEFRAAKAVDHKED